MASHDQVCVCVCVYGVSISTQESSCSIPKGPGELRFGEEVCRFSEQVWLALGTSLPFSRPQFLHGPKPGALQMKEPGPLCVQRYRDNEQLRGPQHAALFSQQPLRPPGLWTGLRAGSFRTGGQADCPAGSQSSFLGRDPDGSLTPIVRQVMPCLCPSWRLADAFPPISSVPMSRECCLVGELA